MVNAGYTWRNGFPTKADPTQFAAQLKQLQHDDGTIDIDEVLEANRQDDAPLHDEIEWDDEAAARQYRLSYVRDAMGALRVIPVDIISEETMQPVRAVIPTRVADRDTGTANTYVLTVTLEKQDEEVFTQRIRQEAIGQVRKMAQRFRVMRGCEDIAEQLYSVCDQL